MKLEDLEDQGITDANNGQNNENIVKRHYEY